MSLGRYKFQKAFESFSETKRDEENLLSGILGLPTGAGQNTVEVDGRIGFVYVRLRDNLNEVIQAYNDKVSPVYNLPVLIARDRVNTGYYQIVTRDVGRYQNWETVSPYLPRHGNQHAFDPESGGGGDVVFVEGRQFVPLALAPSGSAGSGNVIVEGSHFYTSGEWKWAGDTGTPDILAFKPLSGTSNVILVYIDGEDTNPKLLEGLGFDPSISGTANIIPFLPPVPTSEDVPLGAIQLHSGTERIAWEQIYDLRPYIVGSAFIPTGTYGHIIRDEGIDEPKRSYLNFIGQNVWVNDDPANDETEIIISGSAGGAGVPGGVNKDIQFNNAGAFDGNSNLQWDNAGNALNVSGTSNLNGAGGVFVRGGALWVETLLFMDDNNILNVGILDVDGRQQIDATEEEAFLVRKDGDGGDVFVIDTVNSAITFPNTGLHILDTDASHDLIISPGSDLTADRTLTLTTGDAARTVTLSGNPTLNDWFDQNVKIAASPTFAGLIIVQGADASVGVSIERASATGRAQLNLLDENSVEVWRIGMTGAGSTAFSFYDQTNNAFDLAQNGDITFAPGGNVVLDTKQIIDVTSAEALLVRKNADGGDVFVVDTQTGDGRILMQNNVSLNWRDGGGISRRIFLLSGLDDIFFGAVDAGWGAFGDVTRFSAQGALMSFRTNGQSGAFVTAGWINHSGNWAIGNKFNPDARLHVIGSVDNQQLIVQSHSTQTNNVIEQQQSDGTIVLYTTNAGGLKISDKLIFTQADGNEAIDSLADGYMDYLATTAHRFNADVNVTGMVRQSATWHAYGGFEDQAETIACGVGDWNHITNAGNNLWTVDEADGITEAADVFTIVNTGHYVGNLSISISGLNGKDFHVRIYNNTQARVEGRPIGISTTGANNEMNVSVPLFIEATAGDELQFEIMSTDGADPVVDDAIFIISYLHD